MWDGDGGVGFDEVEEHLRANVFEQVLDGVADEVTTVVYATPSRESNSSTSNGQPLNSPRTSGSSGSSTPRPDTSSFQTSAAATADLMKKSPSLRSVA